MSGGTCNIGIGIIKSRLDNDDKIVVPFRNLKKAEDWLLPEDIGAYVNEMIKSNKPIT